MNDDEYDDAIWEVVEALQGAYQWAFLRSKTCSVKQEDYDWEDIEEAIRLANGL